MPKNRQTPRYVCLAAALGIVLSIIPSCREVPTSQSAAPHRSKTGSVLLTFDPSINGRKNEAELWALMIELTTKRAKELGGETEVSDLGNHQLRVTFFDHQEQDLARIRRRMLGIGILEFRILHPTLVFLTVPPAVSSIPEGYELMSMLCTEMDGRDVEFYNLVQRTAEMTETVVTYTEAVPDDYGGYMIMLHLTPAGQSRFAEVTGANIGRHLGIVFDGKLYSAPMIRDRIESDAAQITGRFTQREALELANILNNPLGLPATLTVEP